MGVGYCFDVTLLAAAQRRKGLMYVLLALGGYQVAGSLLCSAL